MSTARTTRSCPINLLELGTGDYSGAQDVDPEGGTAYMVIGAGGVSGAVTVNLGTGAGNGLVIDNTWTYSHAVTLDGAGGSDRLTGDEGVNTWTLTGPNAGTLTGAGGGAEAVAFSGIETLTGIGGSDTLVGQGGAHTWELGATVT